VNSWIA